MAVPTCPRADRIAVSDDPFVTPPRGIEATSLAPVRPSASEVNMTPTASGFTPRLDRLAEPISAENAQAIYPPQACVFVANLSSQRTDEQLMETLEHEFGKWGECHAKVRRDRQLMPYAFVQYHEIEHARIAIRDSKNLIINGRPVRAEICQANRTLLLTRLTGGPVSDQEARSLLEAFGAIEETSPVSVGDQNVANLPEGRWVKFAFYQDCSDAQLAFRHHEYFRLIVHRASDTRTRRHQQDQSPTTHRSSSRLPIQPPTTPRFVPDNQSIFIGDLPVDVTNLEIRHLFSEFGRIVTLNVLRKPVEDSEEVNTFGFVGYDDVQSVENALLSSPTIRGHHIRVERKEYNMRRQVRMGMMPHSPRGQRNPILVHLYNQGVQMGLPRDLAARILSIGRRPRTSSAYGNPPYGSPAVLDQRYGAPNRTFGYPPYHFQSGNAEHQQLAAQHDLDYQQLAPPTGFECPQYPPPPGHEYHQLAPTLGLEYQQFPAAGPEYHQLAPPQGFEYQQIAAPQHFDHQGQNGGTQFIPPPTPHIMSDGTTYYSTPNHPYQHPPHFESGMPAAPMHHPGYYDNYVYETYTPLGPIEEVTEQDHHHSHPPRSTGTYDAEPYVAQANPQDSAHSDDQSQQ